MGVAVGVSVGVLRRFTFTEYDADGHRDAYPQWDKLKSAYTILASTNHNTRPMIDAYRKHHPPAVRGPCRSHEATDDLIDPIVYRLYGLTEEEIVVVEGRTTASDYRNTR